MTTAVKKKEEAQLPAAMMADFEAEAGTGMEAVDKDCTAIPFLKILQKLSPQCEKSDGKYIPGAEEGMIFNTVTEDTVDGLEGIEVVPVLFNRRIIEWEGTESGSGLVAIHDLAAGLELMKGTTRDDKNNDVLPNGHCLVDVREHYVLVVQPDGTTYPALISMSKSQSRIMGIRLVGQRGPFNPPSYSHVYKLTTITERNKDNKPYSNWKCDLVRQVGADEAHLVGEAKMMLEGLRGGTLKADHAQMAEGSAGEEDTPF